MSLGVSKGIKKTPHKMLIFGGGGIGKTSTAADAPNPVFLDLERGSLHLDVARADPEPKSFQDIINFIGALTVDKHEHKTLVIDSLDRVEELLWGHVAQAAGKASIEDFGYAKGYVLALAEWQRLIRALTLLQDKTGMNVILIGHSEIKTFNDPQTLAPYDRYQLKLHHKAGAYIREYVDSMLFCTFEVFSTGKKEGVKSKAHGDVRVMYTERRPGYDAKNRLGLPERLPLSWEAYVEAATKGNGESAEGIISNIYDLTKDFPDRELVDKIEATIVAAKNDAKQLSRIRDKVRLRAGISQENAQ